VVAGKAKRVARLTLVVWAHTPVVRRQHDGLAVVLLVPALVQLEKRPSRPEPRAERRRIDPEDASVPKHLLLEPAATRPTAVRHRERTGGREGRGDSLVQKARRGDHPDRCGRSARRNVPLQLLEPRVRRRDRPVGVLRLQPRLETDRPVVVVLVRVADKRDTAQPRALLPQLEAVLLPVRENVGQRVGAEFPAMKEDRSAKPSPAPGPLPGGGWGCHIPLRGDPVKAEPGWRLGPERLVVEAVRVLWRRLPKVGGRSPFPSGVDHVPLGDAPGRQGGCVRRRGQPASPGTGEGGPLTPSAERRQCRTGT